MAVKQLQREGLVSPIYKKRLSFSVETNNERNLAKIQIPEKLFNYSYCPLCKNKLITNERYTYWEYSCKYSCYNYEFYNNTHHINIFKTKLSLNDNAHKSIKGQFVKSVEKQIDKMKKNNRYLVEILIR